MTHPALFIQGQWRSGQGTLLEKSNPVSGEKLWSAMSASSEDVESACLAAREAFPAWARRTLAQRGDVSVNW
ncbi:aldehyde dehydrogenase family protein, partial [Rouxiella badensis]|uniref:aldehyde dehydrogenase family protein n=1 Tax=Rouxiella badensis TaxID=1646377 RepID=UPI0028D1CAFD